LDLPPCQSCPTWACSKPRQLQEQLQTIEE
jgi:hypothetical protein